ncbi:MAG: hypothetical protein WCD86_16890 [Ktedonobacteraceae bacterium]
MSFDWLEYFDIAQELVTQAKNNSPHQEANLRVAISRAYYAVFNKARDHLRRHDKIREPSPLVDSNGNHINIHAYVREKFKNSADADYREIGLALERMVKDRNAADYDLTNIVFNKPLFTTQANLIWAKDALQRLKRLQKS